MNAEDIYKKLIALYPRAFRKRFGESMEQTFGDLSLERHSAGESSFRFFLGIFAETSASVVGQHLSAMRERIVMQNSVTGLVLAAVIGTVFVVPFAILEYINTQGFKSDGFPAALFVFLWLLPFAFILLLTPTVRHIRSGVSVAAHPASLVLRVVLMIAIAGIWVTLMNDQMPCFLGVPNCD